MIAMNTNLDKLPFICNLIALHKKELYKFELAEDGFDPVCLRGKYWEFIKEDIVKAVEKHNNQ